MKKAKVERMEREYAVKELRMACELGRDKGMVAGGVAGGTLMIALVSLPLIFALVGSAFGVVDYGPGASFLASLLVPIFVAAVIMVPIRDVSWNVSLCSLRDFTCVKNSDINNFIAHAIMIATAAVFIAAGLLVAIGGLMATGKAILIWIGIKLVIGLVWYKIFQKRARELEAYDW